MQQQQAAQSFVPTFPLLQRTPVTRYRLSGYARVGQVCGTSQAPRGWQADPGSSRLAAGGKELLRHHSPTPRTAFSDFTTTTSTNTQAPAAA